MSQDERADTPRIAIIGAGMAGLGCAHALRQAGLAATLFEKSRGIGGRLATRGNDAGDRFDHGAQYITTPSPEFAAFIDRLERDGAAAPWQPRIGDEATGHRHPWRVGTPGMNALLKPLAKLVDIRSNTTIIALQRRGERWQLRTSEGLVPDAFDVVVSTAPAAQTHALFAVEPALQRPLEAVALAPCWALMIAFQHPLEVDFDARRFDRGATAWLARQASRPGHAQSGNAWVAHASADWSAKHLELAPEQALAALQQDMAHALGRALPPIRFAQAHRWRYAMTTQSLGQPFIANPDRSLFAGGDWCLGARVECAYRSGMSIAAAVVETRHAR